MWVTEFDWNGDLADPDVPWDFEEYAKILEDFYTLMFSQEVGNQPLGFQRFSLKFAQVYLRHRCLETNHL